MCEIKECLYPFRYIARIVIEATTPLAVSNGKKDIITDSLVATDPNDYPYIPGTSLAGVIRDAYQGVSEDELFGKANEATDPDKNTGTGSKLIVSEARLVNFQGQVLDGLREFSSDNSPFNDKDFNSLYEELPIRQHVRINEKGVSEITGKFNEQLILKGSRFCFEMELVSDNDKEDEFDKLIHIISKDGFRIGGKTRGGFGAVKIVSLQKACLDLRNEKDLNMYVVKPSHLDRSKAWAEYTNVAIPSTGHDDKEWIVKEFDLVPDNFILFGSGFGNMNADATPLYGRSIKWDSTTGKGEKKDVLILPAASFKGAIAHRVAYHYNRLSSLFIGNEKAKTGQENLAVKELFGYTDKNQQERGNVLLYDLEYSENRDNEKIMNHVAIDRFTGGAMPGALYNELAVYTKQVFHFKMLIQEKSYSENVIKALDSALNDVKTGLLPLGGTVNRGNGCFTEKK